MLLGVGMPDSFRPVRAAKVVDSTEDEHGVCGAFISTRKERGQQLTVSLLPRERARGEWVADFCT